jgi:hypothetical protein
VPDDFLLPHLTRYHNKEQFTPAKSQRSMYQKGFKAIYCNPVPIAAACLLGKDVVTDALNTLFLAFTDLVKYNRDLNLQFGFAAIRIIGKALNVTFAKNFIDSVQDKTFENTMKRSTTPVSSIWKSNYTKTFAQSTLGSLIQKPNHDVVQTLNEKTMALKLMSLDLSSSSRFSATNGF